MKRLHHQFELQPGNLGLPFHSDLIRDQKSDAFSIGELRWLIDENPEFDSERLRITNDPRVVELSKQNAPIGADGSKKDFVKNLFRWWAWRANEAGTRTANANLERFLNRQEYRMITVGVLTGIRVDQRFRIDENFSIEPLSSVPYFHDKVRFRSSYGVSADGGTMFNFDHCSAITYRFIARKGASAPLDRWEVNDWMSWINALLNVLPNVRCEKAMVTTVSDARDPFGIFGSRSWIEEHGDISSAHLKSIKLGKEEISSLKKVLKSNRLADPKIGSAVYTIGAARRRLKDEDFYLGAATFVEQVFGQDDRHFRTYAVRAAWLLGVDRTERLQLADQVYDIFRIRNDVVHKGSITPSNKKRVDRELHERLCTEIIKKIATGRMIENLEYGR